MLGFKLSKFQTSVTFIAESETDYHMWFRVIRSHVIQKSIRKAYEFKDKLGQGAFGQVYLAKNINEIKKEV